MENRSSSSNPKVFDSAEIEKIERAAREVDSWPNWMKGCDSDDARTDDADPQKKKAN